MWQNVDTAGNEAHQKHNHYSKAKNNNSNQTETTSSSIEKSDESERYNGRDFISK